MRLNNDIVRQLIIIVGIICLAAGLLDWKDVSGLLGSN